MKKTIYLLMSLALCCTFALQSCGSDDDDANIQTPNGSGTGNEGNGGGTNNQTFDVVPDLEEYGAYIGHGLVFKVTSYTSNTVTVSGTSKEVDKNTFDGGMIIPAYIKCGDNKFTVTSIDDEVFSGFSKMTEIVLPSTLKKIGYKTFLSCHNLTSVEIPNSVTMIGNCAFESCSSLTSVEIPNSVTTIGESAFYGCSSLTSVKIPNSVTTIRASTFASCTSLISVIIGDSVMNIGFSAFYNCSSLTEITSLAVTPPITDRPELPFDNITLTNGTLKVPAQSVEAYKKAEGWKEFKNIVGI